MSIREPVRSPSHPIGPTEDAPNVSRSEESSEWHQLEASLEQGTELGLPSCRPSMSNNWERFSRMRSEGFSFNSWGSGGRALFAIRCLYVGNRPQPSATVRGRALRRCHWGKLLQVTIHGCVTCQFAPLFHCDLHEKDMSRKQRDAFRLHRRSVW